MTSSHRLSIALAIAGFVCLVPTGSSAQLASRPADEWIKVLDSPERLAGLKIDEVIAKLQLKPGLVIADLGAGSGIFSVPIARAVAPGGKVYAVEVDQGMLDYVRKRTANEKTNTIVPVLGKFTDPALPATDVDLAFLHDVLHHIEDRAGYVKQLPRYLKPGARIAVVDFNPQNSPHKDDPKLQVSKEQTRALMADVGFVPVEDIPLFDDKWFVIYAKK